MSCPGCDRSDGVKQTSTTPVTQAWHCSACGMSWATSVVNPPPMVAYLADLCAAVEEVERLRWSLRKVIELADEAAQMSDERLRERLLALAVVLRPGPAKPSEEPESP